MKTIIENLKSWALLFLLFALSGCRESEDVISARSVQDAGGNDREVVVFTWEEYFNPKIIEKFETETGITVRFEYFDSLGALIGQLQSQPDRFDVIVVDDVTLQELIDVKMLRPLDKSLLGRLGNFEERYLDQGFDPGNRYSVPYLWGTTLVAYRRDRVPNPEHSWSLLWDPALKGRVALMDEKDDLYASSLLSLGLPMGTEDPDQLAMATKHLAEQVKAVHPAFSALEDIKDQLAVGKYDVACLYSGDAAILAEEDDRIAYFIPKEGAPLWMDNLAIAREAKNVKGAHAFIDFLSDGAIAAENANYLWYATPNKAAIPFLSEDLLADESVYPPKDVLERCKFHALPSLARIEIMNRGMKQIFDWARSEMVQTGEGDEPETAEQDSSP